MDTKWIIVLVFAFVYGLFEMYINVRQKTKSNVAKSSDKGSLKFLFIFLQIGTLLSFSIGATKIGKIDYQYTFIVLGIILVLIGLIIRIKSFLTLKQQYTYTVTIVENHQLVETGLYKYIRHPGYLGLLIICLGISTALSNWLAILFMIIPVTIGILNRIKIEEIFLIEQMGQKYITYQKRTKKLIPKIY